MERRFPKKKGVTQSHACFCYPQKEKKISTYLFRSVSGDVPRYYRLLRLQVGFPAIQSSLKSEEELNFSDAGPVQDKGLRVSNLLYAVVTYAGMRLESCGACSCAKGIFVIAAKGQIRDARFLSGEVLDELNCSPCGAWRRKVFLDRVYIDGTKRRQTNR